MAAVIEFFLSSRLKVMVITPASGHSAFEAENVDALVRATDRFAG